MKPIIYELLYFVHATSFIVKENKCFHSFLTDAQESSEYSNYEFVVHSHAFSP